MGPDVFPRHTLHDPALPVWCLTPETPGCIHRFFDTSPVSPSGRYVAVFQLPFEDRPPRPGEAGFVRVIDLETGENRIVAESKGWEPQLGANVNWGGSDHELFFNDVDTGAWTPFAWKLDPLSGDKTRLEGTVYHASPDGRLLVSSSLARCRFTQQGYGVTIPEDRVTRNLGPAADDGFFLTDTRTGKRRLLLSLREIFDRVLPDTPDIDECEVYGFHCKFNSRGDRLMLSIRWYQPAGKPVYNMFARPDIRAGFAWITCDPEGGHLHCAAGPELWVHGGHHATWFPDGRRISMNLALEGGSLRFAQVNADGAGLRILRDELSGSGHPTVAPDGRHLLTDTYTREPLAFEDGSVPLRWIDLHTGDEECLVRIPSRQHVRIPEMRVDPHPAWDRSGRHVVFNGFVDGTRRVFLADMQTITGLSDDAPEAEA